MHYYLIKDAKKTGNGQHIIVPKNFGNTFIIIPYRFYPFFQKFLNELNKFNKPLREVLLPEELSILRIILLTEAKKQVTCIEEEYKRQLMMEYCEKLPEICDHISLQNIHAILQENKQVDIAEKIERSETK